MHHPVQRADEILFGRNSGSLRLYRLVRSYILRMGPVAVVPRSTQVGFKYGRTFASVWLPQMWIKRQPQVSITVTFGLDHRVRDRRIKQSVQPYPGRFTHHVVLLKASDFDAKVKAWLREAFELAAKRSKQPPSAAVHRAPGRT